MVTRRSGLPDSMVVSIVFQVFQCSAENLWASFVQVFQVSQHFTQNIATQIFFAKCWKTWKNDAQRFSAEHWETWKTWKTIKTRTLCF